MHKSSFLSYSCKYIRSYYFFTTIITFKYVSSIADNFTHKSKTIEHFYMITSLDTCLLKKLTTKSFLVHDCNALVCNSQKVMYFMVTPRCNKKCLMSFILAKTDCFKAARWRYIDFQINVDRLIFYISPVTESSKYDSYS